MTHKFIVVRHGNTFGEGEPPRRIGARTDLPLVASGQEQAQRLGTWLAAEGGQISRILSSPLRRTRETAAVIGAALPDAPPVEVSTLLAEVDHGPDENQPEDAVLARIGVAALDAWDRRGTVPGGWIVDGAARIAGWRALFASGADGTTLLVTSNGAARFALLADPGLTAQAHALPSLKLRTGACGLIEAQGDERRLVAWDQRP